MKVVIGSAHQPHTSERRSSDGTYCALSVGHSRRFIDHQLDAWQQSLVLGTTTGQWRHLLQTLFGLGK